MKREEFIDANPVIVRARVEAMERLPEGLFTLPGTNRKFGLDMILDLIPLGGSVIAAAVGSYLAWEARALGMPKTTIVRMAGNISFDSFLGAIPDFFFRSNTRNLKMIKKHLDWHHPEIITLEG